MITYYIYILANEKNTTLHVGMTTDLENTAKKKKNYGKLICYEMFSNRAGAIKRTVVLKKWCESWQARKPNKRRFTWDDLYEELLLGL